MTDMTLKDVNKMTEENEFFFDEETDDITDIDALNCDDADDDDDDITPIIDIHAHIGHWSADNVDFTQEVLEEAFNEPFDVPVGDDVEKNEVKFVLISNMNGIDTTADGEPSENEFECNESMLDVCAGHEKFKAMIVGQPGHGDAGNLVDLLDRRYDEIFGLKLHPNTLMLDANDPLYEPYMDVASEYDLPVLFHSQDKWSSPYLIYETAQKFPEVPTILAHMGMGDDTNHYETLGMIKSAVMSESANLYADVSWLSPDVIIHILGTTDDEMMSRFLWGTDIPLGPFGNAKYYPARVAEVKNAIYATFEENADELCHKLFFKNAYDLFFKRRFEEI